MSRGRAQAPGPARLGRSCAPPCPLLSPHRLSKKARTSFLSTFLSMLAAYTVREQRSTSSADRGMSSWLTGMMAVLEASTRSGELPSTLPVFSSACGVARMPCVTSSFLSK